MLSSALMGGGSGQRPEGSGEAYICNQFCCFKAVHAKALNALFPVRLNRTSYWLYHVEHSSRTSSLGLEPSRRTQQVTPGSGDAVQGARVVCGTPSGGVSVGGRGNSLRVEI